MTFVAARGSGPAENTFFFYYIIFTYVLFLTIMQHQLSRGFVERLLVKREVCLSAKSFIRFSNSTNFVFVKIACFEGNLILMKQFH